MTEDDDFAVGKPAPLGERRVGREDPARILSLVTATGDRRVLEEWIDGQAEYQVVEDGIDAISADDFDLCILDPPALAANLRKLRDWKESADPVVLPSLLVYPEMDSSITEVEQGVLADSVLRATIDEIVSMPLRKAELAWRVEALLRLRSQSQ